jgi:HPt (histidine-containing phosphotransfer) domain-containing protein
MRVKRPAHPYNPHFTNRKTPTPMAEINYTAVVAKDLEDLIPVFLKNRTKELDSLSAALKAGDYEQLKQLGHRMKGVGNSYGFPPISEFGKLIEDSARKSDTGAISGCITAYTDYLANVKIVYE